MLKSEWGFCSAEEIHVRSTDPMTCFEESNGFLWPSSCDLSMEAKEAHFKSCWEVEDVEVEVTLRLIRFNYFFVST